jgi:hypothetical protein
VAALTSFGLIGCHPSLTLSGLARSLRARGPGTLVLLQLCDCAALFFPPNANNNVFSADNPGWPALAACCPSLQSLDLSFSGDPWGSAGVPVAADPGDAEHFAAAATSLVQSCPLLGHLWLRGCPALQGPGLADLLGSCGPKVRLLDLGRHPSPAAAPLAAQWPPHGAHAVAALLRGPGPARADWSGSLVCLSLRGACLGESGVARLAQLRCLEQLDLAAVDGVSPGLGRSQADLGVFVSVQCFVCVSSKHC